MEDGVGIGQQKVDRRALIHRHFQKLEGLAIVSPSPFHQFWNQRFQAESIAGLGGLKLPVNNF